MKRDSLYIFGCWPQTLYQWRIQRGFDGVGRTPLLINYQEFQSDFSRYFHHKCFFSLLSLSHLQLIWEKRTPLYQILDPPLYILAGLDLPYAYTFFSFQVSYNARLYIFNLRKYYLVLGQKNCVARYAVYRKIMFLYFLLFY